MKQSVLTSKNVVITVPIQQIDKKAFDKAEKTFLLKFHSLPKALVLQFDIDFQKKQRTAISAKAYAVRNVLKKFRTVSMPLTYAHLAPAKLTLPADKLTLGDIIIPWKRLQKHLQGKSAVDLNPILISNPHIAYTIDSMTYKPSPPAQPNS